MYSLFLVLPSASHPKGGMGYTFLGLACARIEIEDKKLRAASLPISSSICRLEYPSDFFQLLKVDEGPFEEAKPDIAQSASLNRQGTRGVIPLWKR